MPHRRRHRLVVWAGELNLVRQQRSTKAFIPPQGMTLPRTDMTTSTAASNSIASPWNDITRTTRSLGTIKDAFRRWQTPSRCLTNKLQHCNHRMRPQPAYQAVRSAPQKSCQFHSLSQTFKLHTCSCSNPPRAHFLPIMLGETINFCTYC